MTISQSSNWHTVKKSQRQKYKDKVKEIVDRYRGMPCHFCGIADPVVNQFHHVNAEEKKFDVGNSWHSRGIAAVQEEISKCIIVCANDHLRIHAGVLEVEDYHGFRKSQS